MLVLLLPWSERPGDTPYLLTYMTNRVSPRLTYRQ